MNRFLFRFGYCTPKQQDGNEHHGWDDESSLAVFIEADSEVAALAWGSEIAEHYVKSLYLAEGRGGDVRSWKEGNFAHWIEEVPDTEFSDQQLKALPVVRVGKFMRP